MTTTRNLDDPRLADAKAGAAQQRTSLTRPIAEGLQWRRRARSDGTPRCNMRLPVFTGRRGLQPGVDPLNDKGLRNALGDDARCQCAGRRVAQRGEPRVTCDRDVRRRLPRGRFTLLAPA